MRLLSWFTMVYDLAGAFYIAGRNQLLAREQIFFAEK